MSQDQDVPLSDEDQTPISEAPTGSTRHHDLKPHSNGSADDRSSSQEFSERFEPYSWEGAPEKLASYVEQLVLDGELCDHTFYSKQEAFWTGLRFARRELLSSTPFGPRYQLDDQAFLAPSEAQPQLSFSGYRSRNAANTNPTASRSSTSSCSSLVMRQPALIE